MPRLQPLQMLLAGAALLAFTLAPAGVTLTPSPALAPSSALAMGGGSPPSPSTRSCRCNQYYSKRYKKCVHRRCKRGQAWSCRAGRCVRKASALLTDEDLFREGVRLAKAEHYAEARELLGRIRNKQQAKVLNYIGYTTRKLGDLETGIAYYRKALALDPNYNVAREYLGEGYLQKGDLAGARAELAQIERRCGKTCHAYEELAGQIAAFLERGKKAAAKDGAL